MELSKRLKAIAGMVSPGSRVADIGTDHAYLPIALVRDGIADSAVASDISAASADKAKRAVKAAGLSDRISVRQADGLAGICDGEADTVVISGVGGPLIISILASSGMLLHEIKELILSPQSEIAAVREWLFDNGFAITDEAIVPDRGKTYMIIKAAPQNAVYSGGERARDGGTALPEECSDGIDRVAEAAYGPVLISRRDPALAAYLRQEIVRIDQVLDSFPEDMTEASSERRDELISERERACTVLRYLTS